MWLPRNIIYDINHDRKHLQQERLALQPRKKFHCAVRTNRGWESLALKFVGYEKEQRLSHTSQL